MNVTRDEAAEALAEISRAGQRMGRLRGYSDSAVYFVIWGLVWLVAYSVTDLAPQLASLAWGVMVTGGMIASFVVSYLQARRRQQSPSRGTDVKGGFSRRFAMLALVIFGFFASLFTVLQPATMREGSTAISLFFPFAYMAAGLFAGWRLFAIGLATAALVMAGYLWLSEHYYLWMGVVAGGALIAGGLWLRKA